MWTGCKQCKTDISLVVSDKRQEVDASDLDSVAPHSWDESHYLTCLDVLSMMTQEAAEEAVKAADLMRQFRESDIKPQSGEEVDAHQVLSLVDATPEQIVNIPSEMDPTRSFADKSDNTLGEFLQRPLKIGEFTWTPSVDFYEKFNPWELFITNKRNVNRMNNFSMFRSKLRVKVLINGNSFFYGRLMAAYQPLSAYDELTANAALIEEDNVQMSQFPRFFIDPTTSQGGEMTLPFMWFYDYCNLVNEDYLSLGEMTIRQLTSLKHTSGDTTLNCKLNVTVYAWMEDVQLEAPTATNMAAITPQSGFEDIRPHMGKDERDRATKGPVEKVATAVEAAAKTLATVPQIAPFATPAAIGASAVKGIASTMGWCSPSIIEPPVNYRPMGTANTAVTNGADSSHKLTMDGKQELSVDPRIIGLGSQDELDIRYIATRESYLTNFSWTQGATAESLLWNSRVDPCICDRTTIGGKDTYFFPAMCGAALPFKYWNGSIKFRFQIVASAFHRGRIAIVYDPYSTAATREDNVAYTQIIDIATSRDFTVTVGANQDKTMILREDPQGSTEFGTVALTSSSRGNGTIAVYVLNELSLPSADTLVNNDIKVNVFVSAGDDIEFFMPSDRFTEFVIKPQSGKEEGESINPDEVQVSEDYQPDEKQLAISKPVNMRNLVYAGEQILSFRQLLKRYYPWRGIYMPSQSTAPTSVWKFEHCAIPGYRGNVNGAIDLRATGTIPYSFVSTTLLSYLLPAYQAVRGSVRWKLAQRGKGPYDTAGKAATVSYSYDGRYNDQHFSYGSNTADVARATTVDPGAIKHEYAALGTTIYAPSVNPVIEYEIPWYTQERFLPGKQQNFTTQANVAGFPRPGVEVLMDDAGQSAFYVQSYCAAGEDFSMYFFTGWPRLYHESVLPAA